MSAATGLLKTAAACKFELNEFDPKSVFITSSAAGWYQFRVKAYDRAKDGGIGEARELKFNINVLQPVSEPDPSIIADLR
jgi:hypothetical protein